MMRALFAYFLTVALMVTGVSFAQARGTAPEFGMEIVICSGVGLTTITIGPDGQPVEKTHICPDATACFIAAASVPVMAVPERRLIARVPLVTATTTRAQHKVSPSARGPPARV